MYTNNYEAARSYRERGWSVLPLRAQDKRPAIKWRRYQRTHASESSLRNWFHDSDNNVGVIFGEVSGGLVSRDFDERVAYERWASEWPQLAAELPTVLTPRGAHVYALATPGSVADIRGMLGRPASGTGAIDLGDGELRAGVGCYSALPPSVHPSGQMYRWRDDPPSAEFPVVELLSCGFVDFMAAPQNLVRRGYRGPREDRDSKTYSESPAATFFTAEELESSIDDAITKTLPTGPGQRHKRLFEFARRLKAMPNLADAEPRECRRYVQRWHALALPRIRTKAFEDTWSDFVEGWPRIRNPGEDALIAALDKAETAGLPDAVADYGPKVRLLAGVCRSLQRASADGKFFLSCRDAGRLVGIPPAEANRHLRMFVADGFLRLVEKGVRGRASEYGYVGD